MSSLDAVKRSIFIDYRGGGFVCLFLQPYKLELKHRYPICRQFISKGILSSITLFLRWFIFFWSSLTSSAELFIITAEYKCVLSSASCSDTVIWTFYWCEVDDEEHIALSAFGMSYEREYTSVTVIGIDPYYST